MKRIIEIKPAQLHRVFYNLFGLGKGGIAETCAMSVMSDWVPIGMILIGPIGVRALPLGGRRQNVVATLNGVLFSLSSLLFLSGLFAH